MYPSFYNLPLHPELFCLKNRSLINGFFSSVVESSGIECPKRRFEFPKRAVGCEQSRRQQSLRALQTTTTTATNPCFAKSQSPASQSVSLSGKLAELIGLNSWAHQEGQHSTVDSILASRPRPSYPGFESQLKMFSFRKKFR